MKFITNQNTTSAEIKEMESFIIEILDGKSAVFLDLKKLDEKVVTSFYQVIDAFAFQSIKNVLNWKITRENKDFDLSKSYFVEDLDKSFSEMATGQPLLIHFEIAALEKNKFFWLSLWYGLPFLESDLKALAALGVFLVGDGKFFTVEKNLECRIEFLKPDSIELIYEIDFDKNNSIIEV